jgi:ATP-dependent DNA ligase
VRQFTRSKYDWSARHPPISATAMKLRASSFTLDRETVVCGRDGVAIFDAFYRRGTASDQLKLDGESRRDLP